MISKGIKANVVTYSALARPFARAGNWQMIEEFERQMLKDGLKKNEYFLYAQLDAYGNARPKQLERAERCFQEAMRDGLEANNRIASALARVVGRTRCQDLLEKFGHRGTAKR